MKPKFLGKKNTTFKSPSENILDAINRELSKEMFGEDIWNAYEFNFLSKKPLFPSPSGSIKLDGSKIHLSINLSNFS